MAAAATESASPGPLQELVTVVARAFGGAIFFGLPLLMTMEMWWLGFYADRLKIALFLLLMIPVLIVLSHYSGIRAHTSWTDDVADAFVAYGIAFVASALVLWLFDAIGSDVPVREVVGKIALQAVPASFGAILANSQFGQASEEQKTKREEREAEGGYPAELFLMFVGALFLAFNVAPTEEMILLAFKMSHWQILGLLAATLIMMHGFVFSASFRGAPEVPEGTPWWSLGARFTVVGYAIGLLTSAYVLWTFGRYEGVDLAMRVSMAIVLGFPAGLGAAAARLIL